MTTVLADVYYPVSKDHEHIKHSLQHLSAAKGSLSWGTTFGTYIENLPPCVSNITLFIPDHQVKILTDGHVNDSHNIMIAHVPTNNDNKHIWHSFTLPNVIDQSMALSVISDQLFSIGDLTKHAVSTGVTALDKQFKSPFTTLYHNLLSFDDHSEIDDEPPAGSSTTDTSKDNPLSIINKLSEVGISGILPLLF